MQAILFPNTYISEAFCEAVRTCFQSLRIYQPIRRKIPFQLQVLSQKGLIDILIPAEDDDKKIENCVKDYRNWTELHQGGVLEYLKLKKGSIPFFDDTATAQIRADIKRGVRAPEALNPLFNARVFLSIAQEYDLQSEEIARKLVSMNQAERKLFMNLTGEPENSTRSVLRPQSEEEMGSVGYMMPPRILAWAQLFLQDVPVDPAQAPTVFVTIHREALEFLMEQAPVGEPLFKVSSLPVIKPLSPGYDDWQKTFGRIINALPENAGEMAAELVAGLPGINPANPKINLTLYRIAGEPPPVFFARCVERSLPQKYLTNLPGERDYTLLGLVEMDAERQKG